MFCRHPPLRLNRWVSTNYVIILSACLWVCHRAVHIDSTKIKYILATCRQMVADVARTRASSLDAERLKVQEIMAAMHESRLGFGFQIAHLGCVRATTTHIRALHAAGVWSEDADFEVLREILCSSGQSMTYVALTAVAPSRLSRGSCFHIMHIVFVTVSSCHVWFQGSCMEVWTSGRFAYSGRIVFVALMGRPGLAISVGILFSGSVYARRVALGMATTGMAWGVLRVIVEGFVAFVSESMLRSSSLLPEATTWRSLCM